MLRCNVIGSIIADFAGCPCWKECHAPEHAQGQDPPRHGDPRRAALRRLDGLLLDASGIREYEQIHAWNVNTGQRFVTYALRAEEGSGIISVNGSAARSAQAGDVVIIAAFVQLSEAELEQYQPTCVYIAPGPGNRISHTNRSIPKQMAAA